jgi:uncharacterized protein (TIGR04222 family)
MNPFDLRGPEFLAFYLVLGLTTLVVLWLLRRGGEADATSRAMLDDYVDIAYLRGGSHEAMRVATLNLINRGLLQVHGDDSLQATHTSWAQTVSKPIEQRILAKFRKSEKASTIFSDTVLKDVAASESEPNLVRLGLLPDSARKAKRLTLFGFGVFVLAAVAMTKIAVALARGRTNIFFLILEAAFFAWLVFKVTHPFRTPAGDALLSDLRTLFAGLKDRARSLVPGNETQDFALLTAVFGMAAIPSQFPGMKRLFPKASSDSSSTSSGCGSSCGSSCGGGGCGGGCGGCGS